MKKQHNMKRCLCLFLSLFVISMTLLFSGGQQVFAATPKVSSTQIKNSDDRDYVNSAIAYYLKDSDVAATLRNDQPVILIFEGASNNAQTIENYDGKNTGYFNKRTSAVCIVIKKINGENSIVYFNDLCSTLPDRPAAAGKEYATAKDGIYGVIAWNHKSKYAALQTRAKAKDGTFTNTSIPAVRLTTSGYRDTTATGINLHTRTTTSISSSGNWSEGCILISSCNTQNNTAAYKEFLSSVYPSSVTISNEGAIGSTKLPYITGGLQKNVGTLVINRYLYKEEMKVIYGNSDAVNCILSASAGIVGQEQPISIEVSLSQNPVKQGTSCNISGSVTGRNPITSVTGTIQSSILGNVQTYTIRPNARRVNLRTSLINSNLKFARLSAGKYTLIIKAVDSAGKSYTKKVSFTVTSEAPAASTLSVNASLATTSIAYGHGCNILGTVTSNYKINSLKGVVYNSSNKAVQSYSYNPATKSVDLKQSQLNTKIKFGSLAKGQYKLKITASDEKGTTKTKTISFTVK